MKLDHNFKVNEDDTNDFFTDTSSSDQLSEKTINAIQGTSDISESVLSDLESSQAKSLIKMRRIASESAAKYSSNAELLDDLKANFRTFDLISTDEVSSVKTHWAENEKLEGPALSAYKRDFLGLYGWGRPMDACDQDAKSILSIRDSVVEVPPELVNADHNDAVEYLQRKSLLRIPDDHIESVRAMIRTDIDNFPGNYMFDSPPTEEEINGILGRIQGIGMTSQELKTVITQYTQQE